MGLTLFLPHEKAPRVLAGYSSEGIKIS